MLRSRNLSVITVVLAVVASACSYQSTDIAPAIPQLSLSSRIFAGDGTLLTVLHAEQNREAVTYADIPSVVVDAVVAIEDKRFWLHNGVDLQAVARAARANADAGAIAEGGSTITQQYVKNALLDSRQTVNRKLKEMALAWQLERTASKELIFELYLNTIYFGHGAYGAEAAAQEYFGTSIRNVDLPQAALLAGLIQSPSATDPYTDLTAATARRDVVLDEMLAGGHIDTAMHFAARQTPVHLAREFDVEDRYPAAHFVEEVKQFVLTDERFGATEEARRNLLFGGGLRIYTTIDLRKQTMGEAAIAATLDQPATDPDSSLVAIEPGTGRVLAMVGGRDYFGSSPYAKVNLARGAGRQAGSTFKVFVLAAALARGIKLTQLYKAPAQLEFPQGQGAEPWIVRNYGGGGDGSVDLVEATVRSYNTAYAQLMTDVGADRAVEMAHQLGIDSPLGAFPALVLGTENVTTMEMANAYATIANRGVEVTPVMIDRITTADGTVIFEPGHEQRRALTTDQADQITAVLRQVVTRGTGTAAQLDRPTAGKTGTAEGYRDAWFVGYTPQLTTAVWVGFPQQQTAMIPPATRLTVTGGSWPAQIWRDFMAEATAGSSTEDFAPPKSPVRSSTQRAFVDEAPAGSATTSAPAVESGPETADGAGAAGADTATSSPATSSPAIAAPPTSTTTPGQSG